MAALQTTPLFRIRKEKGIGIKTLSKMVACDRGHLSRIERGLKKSSPELAVRISEYFKEQVTRDEILFPEKYVGPGKKKPSRSIRTAEAL